jgi:hypothetical protein
MVEFNYDDKAETLSLLGEPEKAKPVLCPDDQTEMNYHAPTDQWQCPVCGKTNGGNPQAEPDEQTDPLQRDPS